MSAQAIAVAQPAAMPATQRAPRFTDEQIAASMIKKEADIPSIKDHSALLVPLIIQYWSPESEGESKRCWILGINEQEVADITTGELKMLECVLLVEETPEGKKVRYINGSKTLVGQVQALMDRKIIVPCNALYPVKITYLGTKKNRKNSFRSARWEIVPLVVGG
jgi:hypothetical protein